MWWACHLCPQCPGLFCVQRVSGSASLGKQLNSLLLPGGRSPAWDRTSACLWGPPLPPGPGASLPQRKELSPQTVAPLWLCSPLPALCVLAGCYVKPFTPHWEVLGSRRARCPDRGAGSWVHAPSCVSVMHPKSCCFNGACVPEDARLCEDHDPTPAPLEGDRAGGGGTQAGRGLSQHRASWGRMSCGRACLVHPHPGCPLCRGGRRGGCQGPCGASGLPHLLHGPCCAQVGQSRRKVIL